MHLLCSVWLNYQLHSRRQLRPPRASNKPLNRCFNISTYNAWRTLGVSNGGNEAKGHIEHRCGLSSENIVHRESLMFHRNGHITARAGHQSSPADPYRREEGRTWRNDLESTMGSNHREGLAA